jgi:serine/threonine protein phosphatase 1
MYYAIGDIHGRFDLLTGLYDMILAEIRQAPDIVFGDTVVFLGDYIDRGPQTKEVLDFLMGLKNTDELKHMFLLGNHEEFMVYCRRNHTDHKTLDQWLFHGGEQTLRAFGKTAKQLHHGHLDEYIEWLETLPVIAYDTDYVFVHAAIDPKKPLNGQPRDRCLWHFETKHNAYKDFNRIVVHGHITRMHDGKFINEALVDMENNRVWLEVGAVFSNTLAAAALPQPFDPKEGIRIITYRN